MEKTSKMKSSEFFEQVYRLDGTNFKRFYMNDKEFYVFPASFFQHSSEPTKPGTHNIITFDYEDEKQKIIRLAIVREDVHTQLNQNSNDGLRLKNLAIHNRWHDVLIVSALILTTIICFKLL